MTEKNKIVMLDNEEFCLILKGNSAKIKKEVQNRLFDTVNGMITFAGFSVNKEEKQDTPERVVV